MINIVSFFKKNNIKCNIYIINKSWTQFNKGSAVITNYDCQFSNN